MSGPFDNTWLGLVGGGGSAALVVGGGVYQFELWNVGGASLPTRVYVTSKRVGLVAHVGFSHAMILVTGCASARDLEGVTSSGIDWEVDIGASAKALKGVPKFAKYKELFEAVELAAKASNKTMIGKGSNWAADEAAKRLVQHARGELGIVQPGKQFNILPSPLSAGLGAGLFYDWQTMHVMGGEQAWSMISPKWWVENGTGGLVLQMKSIPEQDGARITVAIGIDESFATDPFILWEPTGGPIQRDARSKYWLHGYVFGGRLYADGAAKMEGLPIGTLRPSGRLEQGWSVKKTTEVQKKGTLRIKPAVIKFSNYPYWYADDYVEVRVDKDGRLMTSRHAGGMKE
jgi:hypothetical protein